MSHQRIIQRWKRGLDMFLTIWVEPKNTYLGKVAEAKRML